MRVFTQWWKVNTIFFVIVLVWLIRLRWQDLNTSINLAESTTLNSKRYANRFFCRLIFTSLLAHSPAVFFPQTELLWINNETSFKPYCWVTHFPSFFTSNNIAKHPKHKQPVSMTYLVWARESKGPCRQPDNVENRHIKAFLNVLKDPG